MTDARFTIKYEEKPDYLVATVSGPQDSVSIKLAYLTEVAASCRSRNRRKLLIIEELEGVLSASEVHKLAPQAATVLKGLIIAFVDLDPEHHQINRMGEHIAVDHGAVGRVFLTVEEAERWIAAVP